MIKWFASLILILFVAISISAAYAHEAHRKDMSDAEMAAMKKTEQRAVKTAPKVPTADAVIPATAGASDDNHGKIMADHHPEASFSLIDFLGRLHPALVHFPIALFITAGLAELILTLRPASGLEPTVRFLVYTGAVGGTVATILGWLAAGIRMSDRSETLGLHRWTGTGIAFAGVVAAIIVHRANPNRTLLRIIIAGLAIALLFQGYWGAEMSLGPNHMGM